VLQFTVDVTAADTETREIEGVAVPFDEAAVLAGDSYRFAPGSITPARARTPLLLSHDTARPVGVLADLAERDGVGVVARFSVDRTPDGDAALAQAASGSRGGLSIGAEIDDYEQLDDGTRLVSAARIYEISLVTVPAFAGAAVERVAAEHGGDDQGDPPDDDQGDTPGNEEPMQNEITAGDALPVIIAGDSRPASYTAGEAAVLSLRAQRGEADAIRVQAALTETITTDVPGLLPPAYTRELLGMPSVERTLAGVFGGRALPSYGTQIFKPRVKTPPIGAEAGTLNADATSSKVEIETVYEDLVRWDWAGALSWVTVERSDPDALDSIYAMAVESYYGYIETHIGHTLNNLAVTAAATTLGKAIAAFYAAAGRSPELIVCAPDVWGNMADVPSIYNPILNVSASASPDGLRGSVSGLPLYVASALGAGKAILATRRAVDARWLDPARLTANAIGALNVELGCVGLVYSTVDWAKELLSTGPLDFTPPAGP
jgi:HK97 family phage prohead protease